jgi:putative transposase
VSWGLKRFHESGQAHLLPCYQRRSLFLTAISKRTFKTALDRVRRSFALYMYGYVVMPEHVHLGARRTAA